MEDPAAPSLVVSLLPLLILSLVYAFAIRAIAKEKGRNVTKWTILGLIPIVNFVFIVFAMGAADLGLHRKIDSLIAAQKSNI